MSGGPRILLHRLAYRCYTGRLLAVAGTTRSQKRGRKEIAIISNTFNDVSVMTLLVLSI